MFDFGWADLFSLHALFAGGGWALAAIMAIASLHFAQPNRLRSVLLTVVSAVIFVFALIEGARQHKDARVAQDQQKEISTGLDKIQSALNSGNATPEQVLASAASKLIQQGREIENLQAQLNKINNPPGLYEGKALVGLAKGSIEETHNMITFQLIVAGPNGLDFNKTFKYGNYNVSCRVPGPYGATGSFDVCKCNILISSVPFCDKCGGRDTCVAEPCALGAVFYRVMDPLKMESSDHPPFLPQKTFRFVRAPTSCL